MSDSRENRTDQIFTLSSFLCKPAHNRREESRRVWYRLMSCCRRRRLHVHVVFGELSCQSAARGPARTPRVRAIVLPLITAPPFCSRLSMNLSVRKITDPLRFTESFSLYRRCCRFDSRMMNTGAAALPGVFPRRATGICGAEIAGTIDRYERVRTAHYISAPFTTDRTVSFRCTIS